MLAEEEEKAKNLSKIKNKQEMMITDLEGKLKHRMLRIVKQNKLKACKIHEPVNLKSYSCFFVI